MPSAAILWCSYGLDQPPHWDNGWVLAMLAHCAWLRSRFAPRAPVRLPVPVGRTPADADGNGRTPPSCEQMEAG